MASAGGSNSSSGSASTEDDQVWSRDVKTAFELLVSPPHSKNVSLRLEVDSVFGIANSSNLSCRKSRSEFLDPCQEAAQRSIRCLNRNDGDRTMCQEYFQSVFLVLF